MERIGRHAYANLKSIAPDNLTVEQTEKILEYEQLYGIGQMTEEQLKFRKEYVMKMKAKSEPVDYTITKEQLWQSFLYYFREQNGFEFTLDDDTRENIKVVMTYFLKDDQFFTCKNLSKMSEPSFDKGLLIIGNYGNGKSSIMTAIAKALMHYSNHRFSVMFANDIVTDYEECKDWHEKELFWKKVLCDRAYFDDVKTEREASNYGKANLFKDILEKRDAKNLKTYLTGNYVAGKPNDLKEAIREYGHKYGGRVYERLFKMFNIIEFTGKSFRK